MNPGIMLTKCHWPSYVRIFMGKQGSRPTLKRQVTGRCSSHRYPTIAERILPSLARPSSYCCKGTHGVGSNWNL